MASNGAIQLWCAVKFFAIEVFGLNVVLNRAKVKMVHVIDTMGGPLTLDSYHPHLHVRAFELQQLNHYKAISSDAKLFAIRKNT